jgi:hypothetical protein
VRVSRDPQMLVGYTCERWIWSDLAVTLICKAIFRLSLFQSYPASQLRKWLSNWIPL